jgi:aryl-alcohol dehydrogenase-like predicted oxidoreductase
MNISPYTFGTMSLGKNPAQPESDMEVAFRAMDAGVWFHSSRTYNQGFTFMVLRMAFDARRNDRPRMILKIRDGSVPLMRFETEDCCSRLGIDHIDIAQLVSMSREPGNLVDQLTRGDGPLLEELASLRDRGLIHKAMLFLNRDNADAAVAAADHPLIDGVTLYWNPWQFDCTPAAWQRIVDKNLPVLALRTLGGWEDSRLRERRTQMEQALPEIDPVQLALDLATADPNVRTTIGGTASLPHLENYLRAVENATPPDDAIVQTVNRIRQKTF